MTGVHPKMPTIFSRPTPLTDSADVDSTTLAKLAYDTRRQILQVEFRDGSVYQYSGVPLQTYRDLLGADSKGAYFNRHIRSPFPSTFIRATSTNSG
jgi:hypothetical protein